MDRAEHPQPPFAALEARLGYSFRDRSLGETALTHTSWLNEANAPGRSDNERLEFLGDAVLALVVSDLLMRRLPDGAEGDLTREEQTALYEQLVGRPVGDTTWYEVFAAARYSAIVVQVMNRWADRGDLDADHTIWIDNPVVPCLVSLLDELDEVRA